jgi:hypothetical protein
MSQVNCPTCGAKTDSVISNCSYCGIEISKVQEISPDEYIAAIGHALITAKNNCKSKYDHEKEQAMLDVLQSIPIPSDVKRLTAFFMYCHGNVKVGFDGMDNATPVWRTKAKAAYDGLRLASLNNPQLSSYLDDFKSMYSTEAMKKAGQVWYYFFVAVFGSIALGVLIAAIK